MPYGGHDGAPAGHTYTSGRLSMDQAWMGIGNGIPKKPGRIRKFFILRFNSGLITLS